ncbi:hypothetical protein RZO07_19600 [Pseudomonas protegens]|uniref:hypothetical protein n=1 Tax=Pseudomonas protegens TaxID=380021 RepID=UPI00293733B0|nr:hypothetical protein [Pseudomonas protegens]WOE77514.1 hypothetical protein RZO07_19600 [Pseudomonas protegens]
MSHGFEGDADNSAVARALGISEEDVDNYVTIDTNESDDGLVYNYIAVFSDSTPREVLEAAGVGEDDLSVELSVNIFDN